MIFSPLLFAGLFLLVLMGTAWMLEKAKWLFFITFFILSIIALGIWIPQPDFNALTLVKFITILLCTFWLWMIRYTKWFALASVISISFSLLVLNIGEAAILDAGNGNWINALAGIGLLASIPAVGDIKNTPDASGVKNFTWDMSWFWLISYTVWNWTFIANTFPQSVLVHGAVLLTPLCLSALQGTEHWAKMRVISLTLYLMLYFVYPSAMAMMEISPRLLTSQTLLMINSVSIVLAIIAMIVRFLPRLRATPPQTSSGSRGRSKAR